MNAYVGVWGNNSGVCLVEGVEFVRSLDMFGGVERSFVLIREFSTNCEYGKFPGNRSLEELLKFGVVNLDKPPGPTSHEVVAWVKKLLDVSKAGHGGTLESLT